MRKLSKQSSLFAKIIAHISLHEKTFLRQNSIFVIFLFIQIHAPQQNIFYLQFAQFLFIFPIAFFAH